MNLEEAMKKYGIPIPEDTENYDKEIYKKFDNMYLRSFYNTFYSEENDKADSSNGDRIKTAVVLGGQTGAGKSSLVAETMREFEDVGKRIVLVDDDQYRRFYPYSEEILEECPEHYTQITATATNVITPRILRFASDNGYNFIFDGTMKNTRIIDTMRTWGEDYSIIAKVMATSGLRSLMSISIRNAEMRRMNKGGRFITQQAHDATYVGIPETLRILEDSELSDEIRIYTRSNNPLYPIERFSSLRNSMSSAEKLEELRALDEAEYLDKCEEDISYLRRLVKNLSKREKDEAEKIIALVERAREERGKSEESDLDER